MAFKLRFTYKARLGQPNVLNGDFISEDQVIILNSKLFEDPFESDM